MDIKNRKSKKLLQRLKLLVATLDHARLNLEIHRRVDQSCYLIQIEKLRFLLELFERAVENRDEICGRIEKERQMAYKRWRTDIRWLNEYNVRKPNRDLTIL